MSYWKLIICLFIIIVTLCPNNCYRLPTSLVPERYNLDIITYLDEGPSHQFYFIGRVKIKVKCVEDTHVVTLHSKDLNITLNQSKIYPVDKKDAPLKIVNQLANLEKDFFIIELADLLVKGQDYVIDLRYRGDLIDGLAGYYRSSYIDNSDSKKKKKWLATTQFEATDARRAFPCFDEPALKAKFKISLGHRKHLTSISNMPVEKTENMKDFKDWVWNRFQETVKMSTYLLAFVVSDFDSVPASNNMNIWARKNALEQVYFAKEVGPKVVDFYEKYFDIAYPLPKQDMIAIPDFSAGAMENWGLITYRETYLLLDPERTSANNKFSVASVVAHELAHQWFGNLVTMKWWTDLWLNEGFATYMASVAVEKLYPSWHSFDKEVCDNTGDVFSLDSLNSSHPISIPIDNPNSINEIFDTISYAKGSTIIRMMNQFLGDEVFNKGISNYLKKYSYGNAAQDDLWNALTEEAHKQGTLSKDLNVKTIMDTWTLQTGFPVVNVKRNYETGTADITQERFFKDTKNFEKQKKSQCWWIPLSYTTKSEKDFNNTVPKLWYKCPEQSDVSVQIPNSNDWLIFNIQTSALYRVNYDEKNWKMLIDHLKSKNFEDIHVLNRVLLIDDVMEFARTGRVSYDTAFDLISYVKYDDSYLPWLSTFNKLKMIARYMKRTPGYPNFEKYMAKLVAPMFQKLGKLSVDRSKRDSLTAVSYQQLIAESACKFGVKECREEAVKLFKQYKENENGSNPIPQEMLRIVYCEALRQGSEDDWEFLFNKYKTSNVGIEKSNILSALACIENTDILNRYLKMAIDKNNSEIRSQDMRLVYNNIAFNKLGYDIIKSFLKTNLKEIYARVAPRYDKMDRYFSAIAAQINSEEERKELEEFLSENKMYFEKATIGINQERESMEVILQWHHDQYKTVEQILREYK